MIGVIAGLLALAALPQLTIGAGFAARASISPGIHFVGDTAGTLFTVKVKNTGSVRSIGAVQINRPTMFWKVLACPTGPTGWTVSIGVARCRYMSAPGTADDIQVGATSTFQVVAATAPANANRSGLWTVAVSTTDFSDPSWVKQAGPMGRGLRTTAYSFEVLGAVVAASPATPGDPCPASNKNADPGTSVVVIVCGTNHTNVAQTPLAAYSSLGGTFMTSHGAFSSGPVPAGAMNVVLGSWSDVNIRLGTGSNYTVTGTIGAWPARTSPAFMFDQYVLNQVAPVAADDSYSTNEDTALNVAAAGVLSNDSDANLEPLSAILVSGPLHGALTLNADGSFGYTPDANFNGADSFTYKANDGAADSNVATVNLTINAVNDAPVAVDDSYSTNEDTALNVAAAGVLSNDSDIDADSLSAILVSGPLHGALTLNADGSFGYTPDANFNGADSFTYKANDGAADSNVATVNLTINAVNDAPVAVDDSYNATLNTQLTVAAAGVLSNDSDIDGNPLSSILVSGPLHGSLTLNADGSFSYTPDANYSGADSFTYKANDGAADSNVATVNLTIA